MIKRLTKQLIKKFGNISNNLIILKFIFDVNKDKLLFHSFDVDHFVFTLAYLDISPAQNIEELAELCDNLKNRIIGGVLIIKDDECKILIGNSGIEYELTTFEKYHDENMLNLTCDKLLEFVKKGTMLFNKIKVHKFVRRKPIIFEIENK